MFRVNILINCILCPHQDLSAFHISIDVTPHFADYMALKSIFDA